MADCAIVLLMNAVTSSVSAAISASVYSGASVYKNRVTPIEDARFVSIYRTPVDNEFFSEMLADTSYNLVVDIKCRGRSDDESENILATALNGVLQSGQLGGLSSAIEIMGTFVEYENQGATPLYLAVGRIGIKYMLNNDDQFNLI